MFREQIEGEFLLGGRYQCGEMIVCNDSVPAPEPEPTPDVVDMSTQQSFKVTTKPSPPAGYHICSYDEVAYHKGELIKTFATWGIYGFDGGKIDGSGYGNKMFREEIPGEFLYGGRYQCGEMIICSNYTQPEPEPEQPVEPQPEEDTTVVEEPVDVNAMDNQTCTKKANT